MKFTVYAAALLPIVGAFQASPTPSSSTALRMAFLPDPAIQPSNPLGSYRYGHLPGSDRAPDGTKSPDGVSALNKGTYERLNGYQAPVSVNPSNPFSSGQSDGHLEPFTPTNKFPAGGFKNVDSQLLGSDQAPDGTKPELISALSKGTYERLNGYQNPVAFNTDNPFVRGDGN